MSRDLFETILICVVVFFLIAFTTIVLWPTDASSHSMNLDKWQKLNDAVWRLYYKGDSSIEGVCSSGAYRTYKDDQGWHTRFLTAAHCMEGVYSHKYLVSQDGLSFHRVEMIATGAKKDEEHGRLDLRDRRTRDWAILEADVKMESTIPINLVRPQAGQPVYTSGYPFASDRFSSSGIVAQEHYTVEGSNIQNYLGTTILSKGGSSGSIVVNNQLEVVGILVIGTRMGDNFTLATPVDLIRWPEDSPYHQRPKNANQ